MKVKQLIYTSWKNGSSQQKGFMVYSKSEGISADDEKAIVSTMQYMPPSELPYDPTWEEIESRFPRNVSFFQLPSGCYCMAQASYLGKDYSGRLGNYIIHAYVADEKPDFCALSLIDSEVFRRNLTDEEWNAESAPLFLPEVELSAPDGTKEEGELKAFFTPDRIGGLQYLLAAVMRAFQKGETVYLYDDNENLKCWYKALGYCLPAEMVSGITYATFAAAAKAGFLVQTVKKGYFNYRQQLGNNALVYDFKEKVINERIEVGNFVRKVVEEFAKAPSSAKSTVLGLSDYLQEAGGDLEVAVDLSRFYSGDYKAFAAPQELQRIFDIVSKGSRLGKAELANIVAGIILNNPAYPLKDYPVLYKYLMDNGEETTRLTIVTQYLEGAILQATAIGSYDAKCDEVIGGAPFSWELYKKYVQAKGGAVGYRNSLSFDSFAAYLFAVSVLKQGEEGECMDPWMVQHLCAFARMTELRSFQALLKRYAARGLEKWAAKNVLHAESQTGGVLSGDEYDKAYALLEAIGDEELTVQTLLRMLEDRIDDGAFKSSLEKYLSGKGTLFAAVEREAQTNPAAKRFMEEFAAARFLSSVQDEKGLTEFFNRYFQTSEKMRDVFMQGLEKTLATARDDVAKVKMLFAWHARVAALLPNSTEEGALESKIKQTAFEVDFERFVRLYKAEGAQLKGFAQKYKAKYGLTLNGHMDVIELGELFAQINKKNYRKVPAINDVINGKVLQALDERQQKVLAQNYFDEIFALYCLLSTEERKFDVSTAYLKNVFEPLTALARGESNRFATNNAYDDRLTKLLEKLDGKDRVSCIPFLVSVVVEAQGLSPLSNGLNNYFKTFKRKKLQKFVDEIIHDKAIPVTKEMKKYYEEKIASAKVGLFDKLFSKKKEKEEEEDDEEEEETTPPKQGN